MFKALVILHVLGAAIWVGGHLILSLRYLPEALSRRNPDIVLEFEKKYEPIGIPALLTQIVTGLWMALAYYRVHLFSFANALESTISIKLILLLITLAMAIHVRFFLLPKLDASRLNGLAVHVILVTAVSLMLLYFGITARFGGT